MEDDDCNRGSVDFTEQAKATEDEPVEFVQHAPRLFYQLRKIEGITAEDLQHSFDPAANRKEVFKAGESQGKSGSFFFFTHDKKFLIKTMTEAEFKVFMNFLPRYYSYCFRRKESLLSRIFGVYQLKLPGLEYLYFFLMENSIRLQKDSRLIGIFDLKGSKVNRDVDESDENFKPTSTLKDINFLRRNANLMEFSKEDRKQLLEVFEKDVKLLKTQKLMDYSLLLAVTTEFDLPEPGERKTSYQAPKETMENLNKQYKNRRGIYVSPKGYVYYIGIIDYLQEFDTMKILENRFKRFRHGQKKMEEVSAIEPEPYAVRFLKFVKRQILSANS